MQMGRILAGGANCYCRCLVHLELNGLFLLLLAVKSFFKVPNFVYPARLACSICEVTFVWSPFEDGDAYAHGFAEAKRLLLDLLQERGAEAPVPFWHQVNADWTGTLARTHRLFCDYAFRLHATLKIKPAEGLLENHSINF